MPSKDMVLDLSRRGAFLLNENQEEADIPWPVNQSAGRFPFQKLFPAKRAEEIPEAPDLVKVAAISLPIFFPDFFDCFFDGLIVVGSLTHHLLKLG